MIEYDDTTEILSPYQLAIFNPYENHKTVPYADILPVEYHTIYFDLERCQKIQNKEIFLPLSPHIIDDKKLADDFLLLHHSPNKERELGFLHQLFKNATLATPTTEDNPFIKQILLFIQEHDNPTLQLICEEFNISKSHLIRLFKQHVGIPVHAYILNRKVHKAKRLLMLHHMSIVEVALEAGFYDQSHFHKAFKSVFAITPKEFQKSYFLQD
jgi:AraC-like DNA-binding protein